MFNKKHDPDEPRAQSRRETPPIEDPPLPAASQQPQHGERATIGPSIRIRGDLTGEEDLIVQGAVEGTIGLRSNLVTVGKDGQVNATVNARAIVVEGRVEGDLHGEEQVVVRRSGNVEGNITSPRVTLEDGCRFKGSIDMDVGDTERGAGAPGYAGNVADIKPAAAFGGDNKGSDH